MKHQERNFRFRKLDGTENDKDDFTTMTGPLVFGEHNLTGELCGLGLIIFPKLYVELAMFAGNKAKRIKCWNLLEIYAEEFKKNVKNANQTISERKD